MILHLEEVDELGLASAAFYDIMEVLLWLLDEFFDAQLISKHTVLLVVLKDTKVRLSWHQ